MGFWDAIKRSFQQETAKAAVKASATAVATAAKTAADGVLTDAEEGLAKAEEARAERDDGVVLPSTVVGDPDWLAKLKQTEREVSQSAPAAQPAAPVVGESAEDRAKAELAALKAELLHIEE